MYVHGFKNHRAYVLQTEAVSHNFVPLNSYICTLLFESFESIEVTLLDTVDGVVAVPQTSKWTSAKAFTLSNETILKVEISYKMSTPWSSTITSNSNSKGNSTTSDITLKQSDLTWIQHGSYRLTKHHRSQLCRNGLLDDYHIGALLQQQFPEIGGLYNMLLLQKISLIKTFEKLANLQIIHVAECVGHWIVVSIIGCDKEEVSVYDSLYPSINDSTETIIDR